MPFDSGYVIVRGPKDTTVKATPGQTVTINNLKAGSYTVGLEGFAHDATGPFVSSFQQFSVTIVAGQTATPTVSLQPFGTVIDSMPGYTIDGQFKVFFSKVQVAASYVVQKDVSTTFATPQETPVTDTSVQLSIPATGPYYVRVVAMDAYGKRGTPSAARQITTLTQVVVAPGGATISAAGGTRTFTATGKDPQGNVISNVSFTWTSLNSNVATIAASTGVATAVGTGQSTIVATVGSVSSSAVLTVAIPSTTAVNVWSAMTDPAGVNYLWTVWGTSANNVFAVGAGGTIMRFNGTSWSLMTNPAGASATVNGIWGTSSNDVFASGSGGTILHFNGTSWSSMTSNVTGTLWSVWGAAQNNVFAVGDNGTVVHYDGTSWAAMTQSVTTQHLRSVWGSSATNLFAVGFNNTIIRFDGTAWSAMSSPAAPTTIFQRVWGTGLSDVFAVGTGGAIVHFDGTGWSVMTSGTSQELVGVWGSSSSEVYAGDHNGTILRYDGSVWSALNTGQPLATVYSLWGTNANDLFAVGAQGLTLRGVRGAPFQTFGRPTDLGSSVTFTLGYLMGPTITITSKIELTTFGLVSRGAASQVKLALYTDAGGSPGQLVVQTAGAICPTVCEYGAPQTQVLPGTYWLVAIYDVNTAIGADVATTNIRKYNVQPFTDPLPTTFPPATTASGQNYNYYVKGYVVP